MNQITVTVDLTPENLEILKQLCPVEEPAAKEVETSKTTTRKTAKKTKEAPAEDKPTDEAPAPVEEPAKSYTALDVKAVCLKFSKAGKQDILRAAFAKFGGKKLSDIKEEDYPALMEELADGGADNA